MGATMRNAFMSLRKRAVALYPFAKAGMRLLSFAAASVLML
jgi:predicted nuclease with RNAse H fold